MRLVQISNAGERRVAWVDGDTLRLLDSRWADIYSLAMHVADEGGSLIDALTAADGRALLDYAAVYEGQSPWHLLPAFDHPSDVAHCMVSGTGLTHKASAQNRAAMHKETSAEVTDSAKMYQMGLEGGSPAPGQIGVQPEWFYKGDGSILRAHGEELCTPPYAWDGGEEPEVAGAYVVSREGLPFRVGLMIGNEFSDHKMEKKNYLYLAPSKLRNCSVGPELTVGDTPFEDVIGTVSVMRGGAGLWTKKIWTGRKNMCHTVENLEHHHFKYEAHRRPGQVHIHFFGADAFSFGEGIALESGDVTEISFPQFGRALRNPIRVQAGPETLLKVPAL
jgi:hypothetical protein